MFSYDFAIIVRENKSIFLNEGYSLCKYVEPKKD